MKAGFLACSALFLLVIISGCTDENPEYSGVFDARMDYPTSVYQGEEFYVYLDIMNGGNFTYEGVDAGFFNTGSFTAVSCPGITSRDIGPMDMQIVQCKLAYKRGIERDFTERIDANVIYEREFNANAAFVIMSQEERDRRKAAGEFSSKPTSFTYSNEDIIVDVEITENPVIDIEERDNYVYFTIRSTGRGIPSNIDENDIVITSTPSGLLDSGDCDIPPLLIHENGVFTRIPCKIDTTAAGEYENAFAFISVKYNYELRRSASIMVKK